MKHGEAIRLRALMVVAERRDLDVQWSDDDYEGRYLRRWYSKQFSTPLSEVAEIPDHDILVAYWEEHYESMEDGDLEEALEEVVSTQEVVDRKKQQAREDAEFLRRTAEEAERAGGIMSRRPSSYVEPIKASPEEAMADEILPERIEFSQDEPGDPIDFTTQSST